MNRVAAPGRRVAALRSFAPVRSFHFASTRFTEAFGALPDPDVVQLRADGVAALKKLEAGGYQAWSSDPVTTLLRGERKVIILALPR